MSHFRFIVVLTTKRCSCCARWCFTYCDSIQYLYMDI